MFRCRKGKFDTIVLKESSYCKLYALGNYEMVRSKGLVLLVPEHKDKNWEDIARAEYNCCISTLTIGHAKLLIVDESDC